MLVSREELRYDFEGAKFDLSRERDRQILSWVFNQFLYGEVTGIQCGHWLYRAPHLAAATFLARQATEELSHFRRFLRILSILNQEPARAHWAVRFLSTGQMGGTWGEHVAIEMALGEGLVLGVFYALIDTVDEPEIRKILESAVLEEERHVEFGEKESARWLSEHPGSRKLLLGQALLQLLVLSWLRKHIVKRLASRVEGGKDVLSGFAGFYDHTLDCFEKRIQRLSLYPGRVRDISFLKRVWLLWGIPVRGLLNRMISKQRLLTATYLSDPALQEEFRRFRSSPEAPGSSRAPSGRHSD